MRVIQARPGPCPICGAAHTACTGDSGPTVVTQLPARDGVRRISTKTYRGATPKPPAVAPKPK